MIHWRRRTIPGHDKNPRLLYRFPSVVMIALKVGQCGQLLCGNFDARGFKEKIQCPFLGRCRFLLVNGCGVCASQRREAVETTCQVQYSTRGHSGTAAVYWFKAKSIYQNKSDNITTCRNNKMAFAHHVMHVEVKGDCGSEPPQLASSTPGACRPER